MTEPILDVRGLDKTFGAVRACDGVTLALDPGELHAVIGPNGAGKTTLIGQLAGEIAPDAGAVRFRGQDITGLPAHARAARGLARSFQITSLFPRLTALGNVALAVQAHAGHSFRFWRPAAREAALIDPARTALAQVGLADRAWPQSPSCSASSPTSAFNSRASSSCCAAWSASRTPTWRWPSVSS